MRPSFLSPPTPNLGSVSERSEPRATPGSAAERSEGGGSVEREVERTWRPDWPCPVPRVLGGLRRGPGDPTYLTDAHRTVWKTFRTPEGPTTLAIRPLDA